MILAVGEYYINIVGENEIAVKLALPDTAKKFQVKELSEGTTYTSCIIQLICKPEGYEEPDSAPVAGFLDGLVPYLIYRINEEQYLWIRKDRLNNPKVVYRISKEWSCWELLYSHQDNSDFCGFNELAYIFPYSILNKNGVMFHGVVMEWKSMGILVCAGAGTGKTTHTRMWKELENASIINGDRALCRFVDNHWYTYGSPWNGSSGECINKRVLLKAIVILEQGDANVISRLSSIQGVFRLIPLTFAPAWDERQMNWAIDIIEQVVLRIPIFLLRCRPDEEAVAILKKEMNELYLSGEE